MGRMGMERVIDLSRIFPGVLDRVYERSKKYQKVRDIMNQEVIVITPEAMTDEAARIMGKKHVGSLIVMSDGKPVGIITERDLLSNILARGRDLGEVKVSSVMSTPLITISPTASIKEASQTMTKKRGRLAVFESGKLVGIVSASDLVRTLPDAPETMLEVVDFMTKRVVTADEKSTVARIAKIMGEKRIGSVIITRQGDPYGIFTERDLLTNFLAEDRPLSTEVGKVASKPLLVAPSWISVHHVAHIMTSKHIRRLPIVEDDKLVGIITARDLVEAYSK
jgi:CBS domain-containing protein